MNAIETMNRASSILRTISIRFVVLLLVGIAIDAFSGFHVLRHSRSISVGLGTLFLLALFYAFGEAGVDWISSRDDVSHPLQKRVFRLLLLLLIAATFMVLISLFLEVVGAI